MKTAAFYLLLALIACNHANCGENEAARYARFLDPDASCESHNHIDHAALDIAVCRVNGARWFCQGDQCYPLGPAIRVQRVPEGK